MKKLLGYEIKGVYFTGDENNVILECSISEEKLIKLTIEKKENGNSNIQSTFVIDMKPKQIIKEVSKWINYYLSKIEFLSSIISNTVYKKLFTNFEYVGVLINDVDFMFLIDNLDEELVKCDIFNLMNNISDVVELTEENLEEMVG